MHELRRVCSNEWMKLIHQGRFWITLGLMAVVAIGLSVSGFMQYQGSLKGYSKETRQKVMESQEKQLRNLEKELRDKKTNRKLEEMKAEIATTKADIQLTKELMQREQQIRFGDWRAYLRKELEKGITSDPNSNTVESSIQVERKRLEMKYQLKQDERPLLLFEKSSYQATNDQLKMMSTLFLSILVVFLVADIISGETTQGTIKLLLVRPVSRLKIFLGKWLVSLMATLMLVFGCFIVLFLINLTLYGSHGAFQPNFIGVTYTNEYINDVNPGALDEQTRLVSVPHYEQAIIIPDWQFILIKLFFTILSMMAVAAITFLCSTLFKSTMISTGASLAVVVIGSLFRWGGVIDKFSQWIVGAPSNIYPTLFTGAILITLSIVSFIMTAIYFNRRDVLNA